MKRALLFAATVAVASVAGAQTIAEQRIALRQARLASVEATRRARDYERAAAQALDGAAKARAASAALAARVQAAEAEVGAAEAKVAVIERLRATQRARLAERQGPALRLLAALTTAARRPPLLTLAQPGSTADVVHLRAVMASVLPAIRERTAGLRAEVERGRQLRVAADTAVAERRRGQARLEGERRQLTTLEAQRRQAATGYQSSAMTEGDRAIAMAEDARDITDLMGRIDSASAVQARLERLPGPILRPARPDQAGSVAPVSPAAAPRVPAYRLPVVGTVVTGLGEVSAAGVRARGLTLATRPRAQVVAPTAGRIAYAGPFRGYGLIVVVDHGRGWTSLLTNLASLDVRVGDTVGQGAPIGRAGDARGATRPTVTVELRRGGAPVDIARLAG